MGIKTHFKIIPNQIMAKGKVVREKKEGETTITNENNKTEE
jgi:hypothetical protein